MPAFEDIQKRDIDDENKIKMYRLKEETEIGDIIKYK